MNDDFDGYRKWLGIASKRRPPTHYELLAISLDEDDPDVIRAAVEQRRHYVETKRGDGHDSVVTEILYRISEAESTLLNDEMRRDYDRQQDLFEKRRKSRQVDPYAPRSRVKSQPRRTAGEDTGLVRTYGKIMAILCVSFSVMAWFSFQLPWGKKAEQQILAALVAQVPVAEPAQAGQAIVPVAVANPPALVQTPEPKQPVPEPVKLNDDIVASDEKFWTEWEPPLAGEKPPWIFANGVLHLNAVGPSLATRRKFNDFDLQLEFKLPSKCNTGVFLRGRYEVQLLDSDFRTKDGMSAPPNARCGAIWGQAAPLREVYRGPDQWNTLNVRLIGKVVSVRMNDTLVIDSHVLTGVSPVAWDAKESEPGPVFLQCHGEYGQEFRNIRITPIGEVGDKAAANAQGVPADNDSFESLISKESLDGWYLQEEIKPPNWEARNGELTHVRRGPRLISVEKFGDFEMQAEFKLPKGCNTGVFLRGRYELKLTDTPIGENTPIAPNQRIGAIFNQIEPTKNTYRGTEQWNSLFVRLVGKTVTVKINGDIVVDGKDINGGPQKSALDSNENEPGPIMLNARPNDVGAKFRNIRIKRLQNAAEGGNEVKGVSLFDGKTLDGSQANKKKRLVAGC